MNHTFTLMRAPLNQIQSNPNHVSQPVPPQTRSLAYACRSNSRGCIPCRHVSPYPTHPMRLPIPTHRPLSHPAIAMCILLSLLLALLPALGHNLLVLVHQMLVPLQIRVVLSESEMCRLQLSVLVAEVFVSVAQGSVACLGGVAGGLEPRGGHSAWRCVGVVALCLEWGMGAVAVRSGCGYLSRFGRW